MSEPGPERVSAALLQFSAERAAAARAEAVLQRRQHLQRLQRLALLEEKQNSDLVELRNCIEYINQHTNVIHSALRDADDDDAAVPVCSSIVKDIITVKNNIQESINNSVKIKETLGVNYEPLMENLLKKMEVQLNNWSSILNVASRNLLNSKALMENIQNLIVTQRQICSEVVESELFANFNSAINSTSIPDLDDTTSSDFLNDTCLCSTPLNDRI